MRNWIWLALIAGGAWLLLKKPAEGGLPLPAGASPAQIAAHEAALAEQARAAELRRLEAEELALIRAEAAAIKAAIPAGFTATYSQLDAIMAAGADKESLAYQQAISDAYDKAASETPAGKTTVYTKDTGFTSMTNEEMQARTSYPIWM